MLKKAMIGIALVSALAATSAQAATVVVTTGTDGVYEWWDFNNTGVTGPDKLTDLQARASCLVGECELVAYADLPDSNPETEIALLNGVLVNDVDVGDYAQDSGPWDQDGGSFDTSSLYFMLKFGDAVDAWFKNLTGGSVTVTYNTQGPEYSGGGLSHVTSEVPVPGTLGLLGLGLAGLGLVRRRAAG